MGIVMLDGELVTYINEAAASILDVDSLRYSNRTVWDLFNLITSESRDEIGADLRQRLTGEVTVLVKKEIPIKTFSNKRKW